MSDEERKVWSLDNQARDVLIQMGYEWVRREEVEGSLQGTAVYRKGDERIGKIAFWRYDQYPFYLWGTVTRVNRFGNVETREYGVGRYYTALALLPPVEGNVLISELRFLEKEMEASLKDVRRAFMERLNDVLSGSPLPKIGEDL